MSLPPQPATAASDIVAVLDQNYQPILTGAGIVSVSVRETAKVMEHPAEDGTTFSDHRVIMPVEIDLSLMVVGERYRDTYAEISRIFDAGELVIVQTRATSYPRMGIVEKPHEETASVGDGFPMAVKFRQVIIVKPQFGTLPPQSVSNKSQSSTVNRGQQKADPPKEGSLLSKWAGGGG